MNKIKAIAATDIGKVRKNNEDAFYVDENKGLFIIADGMGGHNAGEIASGLGVESVKNFLSDKDFSSRDENEIRKTLMEAIFFAHEEIKKKAENNLELAGMGSTIVIMYLVNEYFYVCNVGDSRAYLIRDDKIQQITEDHSVVAGLLKAGLITKEEAKTHYMSHVITQALGIGDSFVPDIKKEKFKKNDLVILCTDGLTDMLEDSEILFICKEGNGDLDSTVRRLIDEANIRGGKDNITVVMVYSI